MPTTPTRLADALREIEQLKCNIELLRGANMELRGENVRLRAEGERLEAVGEALRDDMQTMISAVTAMADALEQAQAEADKYYQLWQSVVSHCNTVADERDSLRAENEALKQDAERWLLIRLSNKTRVQVVSDGAWHTLFYGGHGNAEYAIDALRGEGEK